MHKDVIFQSVLIVYAKYYEHRTTFDESTASHVWCFFETRCIFPDLIVPG